MPDGDPTSTALASDEMACPTVPFPRPLATRQPPADLPRRGGVPQGRRLPVGAEVTPAGVSFRVWAPQRKRVEVVIADGLEQLLPVTLEAEGNGYFSGVSAAARSGSLYHYRLDSEADLLADPASRFQPEGPLGPSQVIDPSTFTWTDAAWQGVTGRGEVIYEMHIGTFSQAGTWRDAIPQLPTLAELGITILEVMPAADFAGSFGWGYDGVNMYAPTRLYGGPDDFRAFVDAAHACGLGVILDVVYNHLGPVGNMLPQFSPYYLSEKHGTDWGQSINFSDANCEPVREFFITNAGYWISEFHLDGLRLDATQNIYDFDTSSDHILAEICRQARAAAVGRSIFIVGENEPQDVSLLLPAAEGGCGLDSLWNDDLHHAAMVALTGRREAYYTDYHGRPQEFVSAAKYGFLYQGQWYSWQQQPRGTPSRNVHPERLVNFLQNHDQIANSGNGLRLHKLTSPAQFRAMTAYLLLGPATPMLFMGQEFGASAPFFYFADHQQDLADLVHAGRKEFLRQFANLATPEMQDSILRPDDCETFSRCKLDFSERESHAEIYTLHRDLLRLRREDAVLRRHEIGCVDGAVIGSNAFVLRFFGEREDRLLLINLDVELHYSPAPEPLLAPHPGHTWRVIWSSEDPQYGGTGIPPVYSEGNWRLAGGAAILLAPDADAEAATTAPLLRGEKR